MSTDFQLGALLVVFFLIVIHQTPRLEIVRAERLSVRQVEAAMTAPVFDEATWKRAYFAPQAIILAVEYLRQQRLSIFRDEWTRWPSRNLRELFPSVSNSEACLGSIDEVSFLQSNPWPGFRITGWAWDRGSNKGPEKVILVDEKGSIAGVALKSGDRPDVIKAGLGVLRPDVAWQGFVPAGTFQQFDAYLLRDDQKTICKIGSLPVKPAKSN